MNANVAIRNGGKPILTKEVVGDIIRCLKPSIRELLEPYKRPSLHVVVYYVTDNNVLILFDGPVLGEVADYKRAYNDIARLKANLSARTELSTGDIMCKAPYLLHEGDVIYQGGVNYNGLVVAASGAPAPFDEAISIMIAACIRAHYQVVVGELQEAAKSGGPYTV